MFSRFSDRTYLTPTFHFVLHCITTIAIASVTAPSANAQTLTNLFASAPACVPGEISVPLVEWDFPSELDAEAGAITVDLDTSAGDSSRVWFVSRLGNARLFRLTPGRSRRDAQAEWRSWSLDQLIGNTGGLKKVKLSKDKRHAFIRSTASLHQVDTQCKPVMDISGRAVCDQGLSRFDDREPLVITGPSDIAVDSMNNIYTAAPDDLGAPDGDIFTAYVQKLDPKALRSPDDLERKAFGPDLLSVTTVTRWMVGGGAGTCPLDAQLSEYTNCIAGIDVDDHNEDLIYFSAPAEGTPFPLTPDLSIPPGAIGELNTKLTTNNVRLWPLDSLAAQLRLPAGAIFDPRQLKVERENGKTVVWVVTGSGHLVRLLPHSNLMSAHDVPENENDLFGIALDGGAIGYTGVENATLGPRKDKVGVLLPKDRLVFVRPVSRPAGIVYKTVPVEQLPTEVITKAVAPDKKVARGRVAQNKQGDTFVDAFVNLATQPRGTVPSFAPTGITPDYGSKVGTFFYGVARAGDPQDFAVIRIGRAILPQVERPKKARDDDDFDGDGKKNRHEDDDDDGDGTHNSFDRDNDNDCKDDAIDDDDDDNDGVEDKWDDHGKKETRNSSDHTTSAGGFAEHQVIVPAGSTLLVAQARAANATTPLRIEVFGPTGVKLASPLATPGVAVATAIPATAGTYKVRVTNLGLTAAALTTDLIVQELWPTLTLP